MNANVKKALAVLSQQYADTVKPVRATNRTVVVKGQRYKVRGKMLIPIP